MRSFAIPAQLSGLILLAGVLSSCRSIPDPSAYPAGSPPPVIRFILSFDDGPSITKPYNPTLAILHQLATNDVQPGAKAIFFVQTGHPRGGGTPEGRTVMRELAAEGHLLGIHSVSPKGHVDHRKVPPAELEAGLKAAQALLRDITGSETVFVRPPYGAKNQTTQALYEALGLHMLMADIRARDGLIYGYKGSLFRRVHIRNALIEIYENARQRGSPATPLTVILNFHDVNPYTARHMTDYLHILVDEARRVGFTVPDKPFFDGPQALKEAGLCRCIACPTAPGTSIAATHSPLDPLRHAP
ncbi:MAG: polysaccharide deacetylase family protein [bacterium]